MLDSSVEQQSWHAGAFGAAQQPLQLLQGLPGARIVDPVVLAQVSNPPSIVLVSNDASFGGEMCVNVHEDPPKPWSTTPAVPNLALKRHGRLGPVNVGLRAGRGGIFSGSMPTVAGR